LVGLDLGARSPDFLLVSARDHTETFIERAAHLAIGRVIIKGARSGRAFLLAEPYQFGRKAHEFVDAQRQLVDIRALGVDDLDVPDSRDFP
jgi:hypothetical protein